MSMTASSEQLQSDSLQLKKASHEKLDSTSQLQVSAWLFWRLQPI